MNTLKQMMLVMTASLFLQGCCEKAATTLSGLDPSDFESEYNGSATHLYTLVNKNGMEVCITNFGGRIVSMMVPDKEGKMRDVVLGFDNVKSYFPENNLSDFGAAIGRYANRLDHGHINIDGIDYQLPQNNFGHCLHGGPTGWQYQVYEEIEHDSQHLKLFRFSPDGDNGFPGDVRAYVTYTLDDDNALSISYEATTSAPTVINMTNHSYFNLSGDPEKSIEDNIMWVNSSAYTPIDDTYMTTGEIAPVEGTPFDFRIYHPISDSISADDEQIRNGNGYDHNWVLDTEGDITKTAVHLLCPASGISLKVYTDEPGIQIYTGNFLDGTVTGKKGTAYQQRTGICLETQHYPDSPNKAGWPSAILRPGETYTSNCIFAFSIDK